MEDFVWKRSSRSEGANNCVELAWVGAIRDSKAPDGPHLRVPLDDLLTAAKANHLTR